MGKQPAQCHSPSGSSQSSVEANDPLWSLAMNVKATAVRGTNKKVVVSPAAAKQQSTTSSVAVASRGVIRNKALPRNGSGFGLCNNNNNNNTHRGSAQRLAASMVEAEVNTQKLDKDLALDLLGNAKAFIFDCDGVIWRGDKLIEGIPETIEALRAAGKKMIFVTNNSTKSREGYLKKFQSLGLDISAEEIYSSSYAAAAYLKSKNFPTDGSKKVYVIGEIGIMEELALAGIPHFGGPEDSESKITLGKGVKMEHDENVSAVIVGFDREINYYKIQYATLCIRENPQCRFLATNRDAVTHLTDAQEWAGGGSMVAAVAASSGKEPKTVGKPSEFFSELVLDTLGISPENSSRVAVCGDRLDTDITFGLNSGMRTLLVLTGVTDVAMLESTDEAKKPEFVYES